jgi:hypothetical protein
MRTTAFAFAGLRRGGCAAALLAAVFFGGFPSAASAVCLSPPGDVTFDGLANIVDVQCVGVTALWSLVGAGSGAPGCLGGDAGAADLDCSEGIAVSDVQLAVWHALGAALPAALDADGDSCADACEPGAAVTVVVLSTSGAPVAGASVSLGAVAAITNAQGQAVWPAPPQGQQRLRAEHANFAPNSAWVDVSPASELETSIVLVPAARFGPFAADAPIAIEHARARVEIPGGAVVMPNGAPAVGPVEVLLAAVDPNTALLDGAPDAPLGVPAEGAAPEVLSRHQLMEVRLLAGGQPAKLAPGTQTTLRLPADDLVSQGMGPGSVVPAWWYDEEAHVWRAEGAGELQLEPGLGLVWVAEVSHFTWWMAGSSWSPAACLHLSLTDSATGAPVAGARVWAAQGPLKQKQRKTDSSGNVCFNFYQGGPVVLSAHHAAHGAASEQVELNGVPADGAASCMANPEACSELTFALEPQACLRGKLYSEAVKTCFRSASRSPRAHFGFLKTLDRPSGLPRFLGNRTASRLRRDPALGHIFTASQPAGRLWLGTP